MAGHKWRRLAVGDEYPFSHFLYMENGGRGKRWVFTINNPSEDESIAWDPEQFEYLGYQRERGEQGTEHYQGFVVFRQRKRLAQAKQLLGERAHLELARGTNEQCRAYVTKVDTRVAGPWEFGELRGGQGTRTDLAKVVTAAREKRTLLEVVEEFPAESVKYLKNLKEIRALAPAPVRAAVRVFVLWGPTGTGKTYAAFNRFPTIYRPIYGDKKLWFDGYEREEAILLDEFDGQIPIAAMLQLLDPYPLKVEVKGSSGWAFWTTVVITANHHPDDWYRGWQVTNERSMALMRRFSAIIHFDTREGGNELFDQALQ